MTTIIKSLRYVIPLILFLVIAFFLLKGLKEDPNKLPSALIGKAIPAFNQQTVLNENVRITNKALIGHVSLLNVWATWCLACKAEHSVLMDMAKSQKVTIYGLDYKDTREDAKHWLSKRGNPYQKSIFDPAGTLAINFGVYGTPETFIIDKQGIIRYKYIGPISPETWQETILPLVELLEKKQ